MGTTTSIELALLHQVASSFDINRRLDRQLSNRMLAKFFIQLQSIVEPALFFEVGAYQAETSIQIKQQRQATQVYAFEMNPVNLGLAKRNIEASRVDVNLLNLAVSSITGAKEFIAPTTDEGEVKRSPTSSLQVPKHLQNTLTTKVSCSSLDDFIRDRSLDQSETPVSLWIDVEGHAYEVLSGAEKLMHRVASVFIEVEERPIWEDQRLASDIFEWFMARGFWPIARDLQFGNQYNVIFVNQELTRHPTLRVLLADFSYRCAHNWKSRLKLFSLENLESVYERTKSLSSLLPSSLRQAIRRRLN